MNDMPQTPMTKTNAFFVNGGIYLLLSLAMLFALLGLLAFVCAPLGLDIRGDEAPIAIRIVFFLIVVFVLLAPGACLGVYMRKKLKPFLNVSKKETNLGDFIMDGGVSFVMLFINSVLAFVIWLIIFGGLEFVFDIHTNRHGGNAITSSLLSITGYFSTGGCTGLFLRWKYLKLLNKESQGGAPNE